MFRCFRNILCDYEFGPTESEQDIDSTQKSWFIEFEPGGIQRKKLMCVEWKLYLHTYQRFKMSPLLISQACGPPFWYYGRPLPSMHQMRAENQVLPERRQIFGFIEVPAVIPNICISFPLSRVRISDFLPPPIITQPARPSTRALNVLTLIKFQLLGLFDKADITNMSFERSKRNSCLTRDEGQG
jgi:hypothetical protein